MRAMALVHVLGFHHLAIQVRDLERVAAFYRDLFGLPELARHHRPEGGLRSIWLGLPDGGFIALEQASGTIDEESFRTERPGLLLVALRLAPEARAGALAELSRRGVAIEHQTRWTVYLRDPEGNRVALSHHPLDPVQ